ncbi:MAG: deoxyribose-phosphate aldolase [Halobacteriovoraceae bacterium]|jgi:deoxyribose-phosphate aldolase|nr:deoxyribose-phosphate aldolase [Halobacteriovoraceae bacterium]
MNLNLYIDHTLLKPNATSDQITKLCKEAIEHEFASVCVNSFFVPFCSRILKEAKVKVCTVVGFPLGASPKEVKAYEAKLAIEHGANEIDMVINISALKDELYDSVERDIAAVLKVCHENSTLLKVIIETCLLTDDEKVKACEIAKKLKVDFVKTSTGFSTGGATVEDVKLMKEAVGDDIQVKASGGIKDIETAKKMIAAGATRLGASSGVKLMAGKSGTANY